MNEQELKNKIARLESINDLLKTELYGLDRLLKKVGFKGGLEALKRGAIELQKDKEYR